MPPHDKLSNHSGYTQYEYTHQIDKQEGSPAVLSSQIREAPDVSQTYGRSCRGEDDADLSSKATTFRHKQY